MSLKRWIALALAGIVVAGGVIAVQLGRPVPNTLNAPNVVLVIGCTLRRDQLTPYGGPAFTTPFFGKLARRGALFEHAVDSAPWTRPASTAIITGHHAVEIGMVEPGGKLNRRRLSEPVETLAERLHNVGYETIGVTANPNLNRVFGFHQGFDTYIEAQGLWSDQRVIKVPALQLAVETLSQIDLRTEPTVPLFLQVLTIDTHEPVDAGGRRARKLSRDGVPPRVGAYRVELQRWDQGLEELWEGLNRRGYTAENTIMMVVNDHGEGLSWPPEHGVGHGNFLMPSAVDMPWVVVGKDVAGGHRIGGVASQVDVHPTILGLVGVSGYDGPGRDWSAQIRGELDRTDRKFAFADTYYQRSNRGAVFTEHKLCIHDYFTTAEKLGLERVFPRTACFDRRTDPGVRTPLEEVDQEMVEALHAWRVKNRAAYAAWEHHEAVTRSDPVMQQLAELGYVDPEPENDDEPAEGD